MNTEYSFGDTLAVMNLLQDNGDDEKCYTISDYHSVRVFYENNLFFLHLTKKTDNEKVVGLVVSTGLNLTNWKNCQHAYYTLSDAVEKKGQRIKQSFELGDDIRVLINWKFSGAVDFRKFWTGKDGVKKPSKRGVCYSSGVFKKLINVLVDIQ